MDEVGRVVFEPVAITQEYRYFDYVSPWGENLDFIQSKNFTMNFWTAASSRAWRVEIGIRIKW
jgi:hypothetical protein